MVEETSEMICITCPMGCALRVTHDGRRVIQVEGQGCKRGIEYAEKELSDPRRMVATTVVVRGGVHPLFAVRAGHALAGHLHSAPDRRDRGVECRRYDLADPGFSVGGRSMGLGQL